MYHQFLPVMTVTKLIIIMTGDSDVKICVFLSTRQKQEAQMMLISPHDVFRGQSWLPNIVPFHMLGIVSSCAIVTWSLRRASFPIFDFKKCCDLEIRVRGHSRSLKVVPFYRLGVFSY